MHQRIAPGAAHELVALVEPAVLERDDAGVGSRLRFARGDHLCLRVDRVAAEHGGGEGDLLEPEVRNGRAVGGLEHRHADEQREGEHAVHEGLAELGLFRRVLVVEVQPRRVQRERRHEHVVRLGDGARQRVRDDVADAQVLEPAAVMGE
jgi:sulfur carrier protein ThiS